MESLTQEFGPFGGQVWLNTAHQGALPRRAAEAAREAISWKVRPYELTGERFNGVPARLRDALGRVVGVPSDEIILANSSSYGIHLFANGLPLRSGDEVDRSFRTSWPGEDFLRIVSADRSFAFMLHPRPELQASVDAYPQSARVVIEFSTGEIDGTIHLLVDGSRDEAS